VLGYLFHLAFFVTLLFYLPHIKLFEDVLGLRWPGLPTTVVDAVAMVGIISMIAILVYRLRHPVKRMLSTYDDYLSWAVTFLPLLTGYLAYHHMLLPYTTMLAVHILSVELLMVTLPFTKLTHGFSVFISRWYNGSILGRKGAAL
jgi:nitrate reductase gamma subunit